MSEHHVTEYSVGQVVEQLKYGGYQVNKIFSKPIKMRNLKSQIAKALFSMLVSTVGSHHQLESTVFYLAQQTNKGAYQSAGVSWNLSAASRWKPDRGNGQAAV